MNMAVHASPMPLKTSKAVSVTAYAGVALTAAFTLLMGWAAVDTYLRETRQSGGIPTSEVFDASSVASMSADERETRIGALRERLSKNPLEIETLSNLSILLAGKGDKTAADELALLASSRSIRNLQAGLAALEINLRRGNYAAALNTFDALLRTAPDLSDKLFDQLLVLARSREGAEPVTELLASSPPWRELFLQHAYHTDSDIHLLYGMLSSLKKTDAPPTDGEIRGLLSKLIASKDYSAAYFFWLDMLSEQDLKQVGNVFDPGFDKQSRNLYFDWTTNRSRTVEVKFVPRSTGSPDQILRVDYFGNRERIWPVVQYLLLQQGEYVLSGQMRSEKLKSDSGVIWQLQCTGGSGGVLGQSPRLNGDTQWARFELRIVVPQGCDTQLLSLRASTSAMLDQNISGAVMFDDINVQSLKKPELQ